MSILKNNVLLLKSISALEETDKYTELLTENGYTVKQLKPIVFIYENLSDFREKLNNPDAYSGIIFSSPRCVNAVRLLIEEANNNPTIAWQHKENFVVGEATFEYAKNELDLYCKGSDTGNARNLAKLIVKDKASYVKPFLYPHGNLKSDTLFEELKKEGVCLDGILIYKTVDNPDLDKEFLFATDNLSVLPEYVVFFSPSGVQSVLNYIKKVPVDWSLLKFIAIGPVTAEKMEQENVPVSGVAEKPNPQCVLNVIVQLNRVLR